ncbi:hypothetical protein [Sphingomonas abietis]|uniref:PilZ domain-containing protein n=1 Tax=Sphingomonas abietis TaxID=3012344 RepID=A0ABY7NVY6_9SPHN|nr:hypothetical protein [Sphingomonas abietis]WBO24074.1 hypothetical protein PBT88_08175 [Sphingomonas abietis]
MASRSWLAKDDRLVPQGRRPLCLLLADRPMPVALREVSGAGAWIETHARLDPGTRVTLRHPQAGTIAGEVIGQDREGLQLAFDRSEAAVAFALAAIAADMSRPD